MTFAILQPFPPTFLVRQRLLPPRVKGSSYLQLELRRESGVQCRLRTHGHKNRSPTVRSHEPSTLSCRREALIKERSLAQRAAPRRRGTPQVTAASAGGPDPAQTDADPRLFVVGTAAFYAGLTAAAELASLRPLTAFPTATRLPCALTPSLLRRRPGLLVAAPWLLSFFASSRLFQALSGQPRFSCVPALLSIRSPETAATSTSDRLPCRSPCQRFPPALPGVPGCLHCLCGQGRTPKGDPGYVRPHAHPECAHTMSRE